MSPGPRAAMGPGGRSEGEAGPRMGPARSPSDERDRAQGPGRQGGTRPKGEGTQSQRHGASPRRAQGDSPERTEGKPRPDRPRAWPWPARDTGRPAGRSGGNAAPEATGEGGPPTRPRSPEDPGPERTPARGPGQGRRSPERPGNAAARRAGPRERGGARARAYRFVWEPSGDQTTARGRGQRPRGTPGGNPPHCQSIGSVNPGGNERSE